MRCRFRSRFVGAAGLLLLAGAALAGCERAPAPAASSPTQPTAVHTQPALRLHDRVLDPIVDHSERQPAAQRIVSAAPNVTEICCALGLRAALVGRTRYCDYPPGIGQVPSIGALIDVNVEALLELRPDLILVAGTSRTQTDRFATLDLRLESVPDATLDDLFLAVRRIGELAGRPRTATKLCDEIHADLAVVSARFARASPARVLLLTGTLSDPPRPPYVAGPGSFYDDLLNRAGHQNVVTAAQAAFAPLSLEFIVRADPDVIIELDPDGSARPGGDVDALRVWKALGPLRAVATERIHVLRGSEHYLLGPRIAHTYAALCRVIAGEEHD